MSLRNCCSAVVSVLALAWVSPAHATLTYDLRVVGGGKTAIVSQPFEVVEMELYAVVTGANGTMDEGYQNGYGSFISSGNAIVGGLIGNVEPDFQGPGWQPGAMTDLDDDGDFDIGSNLSVSNTEFVFIRSGTMRTDGTLLANGAGMELKLATLSFSADTIAGASAGQPVYINFHVPLFTSGIAEALWREDGRARNANYDGGAAFPSIGAPVAVMTIPEPATASLLALGLLAGAFGRRRRVPASPCAPTC